MSDFIKIVPLTKEKFEVYIDVGKRSYLQHYLDFWADGDPSPYINESFTKEVLRTELNKKNAKLFIIYLDELPVGVLKIIPNQEVGSFSEEESLLLQKIYLLREHSNKGIGSEVVAFVENFAKEQDKKVVWLDMMVKGTALPFYLKNGYEILSTKKIEYENIKDEKREMYIMVKVLGAVRSQQ